MDIEQTIKVYSTEMQDSYRLLSTKTNELLSAILKSNKINPHSITHREKDPIKLKEKILRDGKNYITPLDEITDLAGVRIISYFPSDIDKIVGLIYKNFVVDTKNSIDKRKASDPSVFGYASVHLVVTFTEERLRLPEYALFNKMKCEIQVRTILQHAWAEIEHDIVYKSHEDIPFELRRKFASLSGLLEIADREFESLKADETKIRKEIIHTISKDNLNIPIDLESIKYYLLKYHGVARITNKNLRGLVRLANSLNISKLSDFASIYTKDNLEKADKITKKKLSALKCPVPNANECDLRYFIAFSLKYNLPEDTVLKYADCPADDKLLMHSYVSQ